MYAAFLRSEYYGPSELLVTHFRQLGFNLEAEYFLPKEIVGVPTFIIILNALHAMHSDPGGVAVSNPSTRLAISSSEHLNPSTDGT